MTRVYKTVTTLFLLLPMIILLAYPLVDAVGSSGKTSGTYINPARDYFTYQVGKEENKIIILSENMSTDMAYRFVMTMFDANMDFLGTNMVYTIEHEEGIKGLRNNMLLAMKDVDYFGLSPVYGTYLTAYILYVLYYVAFNILIAVILAPLKLTERFMNK